ncbi:MAG: hypothetical protein CMJ77_17715 [Planctomycetaceae bacterium]|nr:hypothetical protein [Planctomycetaceae bacterium]
MANRNFRKPVKRVRPPLNNVVTSKRNRHGAALSQRARGLKKSEQFPFAPPEDWHEVEDVQGRSFEVIVQSPGKGYRHVVTPQEIRDRLSVLPDHMLEPLAVVQLSRMTRKKLSLPCYGMQWGNALYLYPIEHSLTEYYAKPPKPAQITEARMFGGRWRQSGPTEWELVWTEAAVKDFYLNNILIHELGHLLDNRNRSYTDRERYAEWFAIEHGYKQSDRPKHVSKKSATKRVTRRHHS